MPLIHIIDEVLSLTNGLCENNSEILHDCEHEEDGWSGPGGRDSERERRHFEAHTPVARVLVRSSRLWPQF